jgi:hypothetical protein
MFRPVIHPKTLPLVLALVLVMVSQVSAQTTQPQDWLDRGYLNLNVGFETTSGTLNDRVNFPIYGESGTKEVSQNVDSGSLFDFAVGSRVWRNVSASNTSEASAVASVPNPVFFAQNRSTTAAIGGLKRTESAFHLQFGYMIPFSDVLSVHVLGGPSFFRLKQDVLADLTFSETAFPFTNVTATPVVAERSDSVIGVNVGVDVAYQLWDSGDYKVGGGMFLRYAGASARIDVIQNNVDTDVGGLQFGLGLRIRF